MPAPAFGRHIQEQLVQSLAAGLQAAQVPLSGGIER